MHLHYDLRGHGSPIVFIHGAAIDHDAMAQWFEPLMTDQPHTRLYLDLPGMGATPALPPDQTDSNHVLAAIQETIHAVLGNQPYTVVGYSYGGYLALGLAFQQPERVQRLFLVCPTLTGVKGERHVADHEVLTTTPIQVTENADYFANYQKVTVVQTPETWQAFQTQVIPGIRRTDLDALHQLHRDHGQHYRLTFETDLKATRFTQPITLLSGRHDVTIGYTDHLAFMARQPNGSLGLFADAGHNLPIDQYQMMATYFQHFLASFD